MASLLFCMPEWAFMDHNTNPPARLYFSASRHYFRVLEYSFCCLLPLTFSCLFFCEWCFVLIALIMLLGMLQFESFLSQGILSITITSNTVIFKRVLHGHLDVFRISIDRIHHCDWCGRLFLYSGDVIDYSILNYSYCFQFVRAMRREIREYIT